MSDAPQSITRLLSEVADRPEAWPRLLELVYGELRALAERRMTRERDAHTLQATALVHEAWLRLSGDVAVDWPNRRHFFAAAAEAMRRVLVDHARRVNSLKRGGGRRGADTDLDAAIDGPGPDQVLAVDEVLATLEQEDARAAQVFRLRFFAGMEFEDVAAALDVSRRTALRDWTFARARLAELMRGGDA